MKVSELIKILKDLPPDALVIQSQDPEGNGFSETEDWCLGTFDDGEFTGIDEIDEEDKDIEVVICLWPG